MNPENLRKQQPSIDWDEVGARLTDSELADFVSYLLTLR